MRPHRRRSHRERRGSVWLEDCVLSGNAIFFEDGSHFVRGGAISSVEGYLQLLDTDVLNNVAVGFGAGLSVQGGAATIVRSNINGNHARIGNGGGSILGGGIFASRTKLNIYESTVRACFFPGLILATRRAASESKHPRSASWVAAASGTSRRASFTSPEP